jgi:hypothetical protein
MIPYGVNGNTTDLLWKFSEYFTVIQTHCICSQYIVFPALITIIYVISIRMNSDYNYLIKKSPDII